jgi:hypothetical protein
MSSAQKTGAKPAKNGSTADATAAGGLQYWFARHDPQVMSTTNAPIVTESAYLTLHYRLATADGTDIVTTFGATPATLMLGQGQLAPFLEQRLTPSASATPS